MMICAALLRGLLAASSLCASGTAFAQKIDDTPRTVIMTAYAPEWSSLVDTIASPVDHKINGVRIVTGQLEGKPVLLVESGVSMVNAAMNTQLVIDDFAVKRIVFSGIAGGVDPRLHIGDVVIPDRWNEYLEVSFARRSKTGWAPPQSPYADDRPNYGMIFPRKVSVADDGDAPALMRRLPADTELLGLAKKVAENVSLARCTPQAAASPSTCLAEVPKVVVGGQGLSGPAFSDNAEFRAYLFKTMDAQVIDMESAAVVHVGYANRVPTIIFRSLSDLAGGDAGPNQMHTFLNLAAVNSARVVRSFVAALPD